MLVSNKVGKGCESICRICFEAFSCLELLGFDSLELFEACLGSDLAL